MKKFLLLVVMLLTMVGCGKEENIKEEFYYLSYNNKNITIGEVYDENKIGKADSYFELTSCAFDGVDKVYTYSDIEIKVESVNNAIYSMELIGSEITTVEGLALGDSIEDMERIYGTDYENNESVYTYTKGNTLLRILTDNGFVTSIVVLDSNYDY